MADLNPSGDQRRRLQFVRLPQLRNPVGRQAVDETSLVVSGVPRVNVTERGDEVQVIAVHETTEPDEQDVATMEACTASEASGIVVASLSAKDRERAFEKCAKVIADADVALARRASCAGAEPGRALDDPAAKAAMSLIARSALDLFGTAKAALDYLDRDNFGGTGLSTRELLSCGRGTSVIARLDELRFGARG